jgi:hypothetical protein
MSGGTHLGTTGRQEQEAVLVKSGKLYIGRAVYARYLDGLGTVVLLRRGDDLLVLPVRHAAAGGYLLKVRNAAGDRVVDAADFFREHHCDEPSERQLALTWDAETAGIRFAGAFKAAN